MRKVLFLQNSLGYDRNLGLIKNDYCLQQSIITVLPMLIDMDVTKIEILHFFQVISEIIAKIVNK